MYVFLFENRIYFTSKKLLGGKKTMDTGKGW